MVAYADDLFIAVDGNNHSEVRLGEDEAPRLVTSWAETVGVKVSTTKIVCMVMRGRTAASTVRAMRPSVGGIRIPYVKVKYLGIYMGENINFTGHLGRVREKLEGILNPLKRVLRKD